MQKSVEGYEKELNELIAKRKCEIRSSSDKIEILGTTYYVSAEGDDSNDGKSPHTAWKTLARASAAELLPGDGVRFRRGDLFRGTVMTKPGVTYAAYGEGEKPRIYTGERDLAVSSDWERCEGTDNIWRYKHKITDCGTLVFDGGAAHSRKLIPSYIGGKFVCRDDSTRLFDMRAQMTQNLDVFCFYDSRLTEEPSKGESFPVPLMDGECYGELYLRCDGGNPGEVFKSIEAVTWAVVFRVGENPDVRIDNICMKYAKFGVSASGECVRGLTVTNCEIGWIGGNIQHYFGTDPNFPAGKRGTVTRYGNGIEIYGGCDGYEVSDCYIYQCYDAAMTHQITTFGKKYTLESILYRDNLVEDCVYSIEYFLEKNMGDTESIIKNCEICGNILISAGYGWGQQRHNVDTPAHIKGWSYENTAENFLIRNNILYKAAYRMIHLVAKERESCPVMLGNTYVQNKGGMIGQYGSNCNFEPECILFLDGAEELLRKVTGDVEAKAIILD